jgi:hypothetical protein
MFVEGVGLPPFRDFYDNKGLSSLTEIPLSWFTPYVNSEQVIYRSRIENYWRLAPQLSHLLMRLISMGIDNEQVDALSSLLARENSNRPRKS